MTEVDDEFDDFGSVCGLDGSGSGLGFGSGWDLDGFGSGFGFGSGWGLDGSGSGVGGVCSFSPNPSPDPDSSLTSRIKLRGSGKLVAVHVKVL